MADTYIEIPVDDVEEGDELPSKTYRIDFDGKRISGMVDGKEALKQAIEKIILTPRFRSLIYDDDYGCELIPAIESTGTSQDYVMAVAEDFIKDALLADSRILEVYDFNISMEGDAAYISFTCNTIYGEVDIGKEVT